ncbi:MAG: UDP-N-acetylglucosamine--LPS N-acetylglucosamine transferase [Hasllibacter sp.]
MTPTPPQRVLAVASGGGHWQQLVLLRGALEGRDVLWLTTLPGLPELFGAAPARIVPDCNRDRPWQAVRSAAAIARAALSHRPHAVISTGALPGVIALAVGKAMRARTIWVDSIANAEEMSMSGRLARRVADVWLTQWPEVAEATGAEYAGAVL